MATVGEELRRERTRKGLTIKDAEQVLHIRGAYLEAIEEDNYKVIPGAVYAKGFIRNYANFLGLDGQALVNTFKQSVGEDIVYPVRRVVKKRKENQSTEVEEKLHRRLTYGGRMARRKKTMERDRITVGLFILFVTLFILWLLFV